MAKKALLGSKIRRLRQTRGLTQSQMAEQLGISASYLNLIEHDERSVTVSLLLKLGKAFDVDLQQLSDDAERRLELGLREIFADATLSAASVAPEELRDIVAASPEGAKTIVELYRAYRTAREDAQAMVLGLPSGGTRRIALPNEEARDFFADRVNHFPSLEDAAEALWHDAELERQDLRRGLIEYLSRAHSIAVEVAPREAMAGAFRRYEPKTRRLLLSEMLARASRNFQVAYQIALIAARPAIDRLIGEAKLSTPESETLVRVGLANYFAGAVLMPYAPFLETAKAVRYDIDLLTHRFGVSFEQACHRLSTLQRHGAKGVPFYLVRVDIAGNLSKRFSASGFHFSRFGGSCPRWNVHEAFTTPGMIRTQIARLPDGTTFFSIARTLTKESAGFKEPHTLLALGIGCELAHARELVYADGYDLERLDAVTEIGVGCRLCERMDCRQRAFPPLHHRLVVDEQVKGVSAYNFAMK
ncbi:MAG TPA: short-chain fatty acyl-CoA regulator family protein [Alphaproteobacteria bacterium]|nr:short-chain fatty acyl-CoA regulator family protein [Alphaproteobacteria bacterium]